MTISELIMKKAEERRLSLLALSEMVGISYKGLRDALSRNDFKLSLLQKIANALNVPITYFFTGDSSGGELISCNNCPIRVELENENRNCRAMLMNCVDNLLKLHSKVNDQSDHNTKTK
jgi:transcriptional regulator with XRE-family HTH domain